MSYHTLELALEEGVLTIAMNRPKVNAQNFQMREELVRAFDAASADDAVRAVILTGRGAVFSAGADIKERGALTEAPDVYLAHNRVTRESFYAPADCEKPVIAALNGPAIGAGYALAAMCDILIASEDAWVQMPEIDRGLLGGVQFLRQHFSRSRSRLLFFTGRRIDAAEMYRIGVIDEVVAPGQLLDTARAIAAEIARKSPLVVRRAKATFTAVEGMTLRDGYRYEQTQTYALAQSEDAAEARAAFLEGREPRYTGK
ncbi:enoyl-CoA hydratase/isomerase family protein [Microbacterium sp. RD1]|uniref:enoyl-CoA hydratase/isomerase family protein n=1 Tax=Microbacterium sp. RD1 TaxID=3457313 RepID=UPI003FA57AC5